MTAPLLLLPVSAAEAAVLASYVVWSGGGGQPVAVARFILDGAGGVCPQTAGNGAVTVVARVNPHPETFPVTVCETLAPADGSLTLASGETLHLPVPVADPRAIGVLGDSGCSGAGRGQPCDIAWPLPALARQIAAERPDLLIHLGDFNYRGTPGSVGPDNQPVYDACTGATGNQNAAGSAQWDGWTAWNLDVFQPLQPVLAITAMVPVRGNHELCSRAGPGWFYFLDPGTTLVDPAYRQPICPQVVNPGAVDTSPPQILAFPKLTLAVLDTADVCDFGMEIPQAEVFRRQFAALAKAAPAKPTWLLTHRPVWAVTGLKPDGAGGNIPERQITAMLQQAANASDVDSWADLILSGHVHNLGALSFADGRPTQLILGNGGVKILNLDLPPEYTVAIDGAVARGIYGAFFGYASFAYCGRGWQGALRTLASLPVVDPEPACAGTLLVE